MWSRVQSVSRKLLWSRLPDHRLSVSVRNLKVTIIGASGGIGQPLSLLIRQSPGITDLALHDLSGTPGMAADHSHICAEGNVQGFLGDAELESALRDADLVIVAAGMPRKPGMTRDQLLEANGSIATMVAGAVSAICPRTLLAFITNPINMIVPIAAEVLKSANVFDPKRLFGITTLDVVRSKKFISEFMQISPDRVNIPVIGGHAGITILPLFSQCQPCFRGAKQDVETMTHRIQEAGTEVVKAKAGMGSATLSMAYAGAQFVNSLLRGLRGEQGVVECAYVASEVTELPYFSTPLELGKEGIKNNLGLPKLDNNEIEALEKLIPVLRQNISDGVEYANKWKEQRN